MSDSEFDFAADEPLPPGLSVIEASAGTGKTFAISHLVPALLLAGTVRRLGQILLVTFTNDAARELAGRTRRVLEQLYAEPAADEAERAPGLHRLRQRHPDADRRGEVLRRALLDIDQLNVSTIDAFCWRVLESEGARCGIAVMPELVSDASDRLAEIVGDLWRERIAEEPVAAAVAHAGKWDPGADLEFVGRFVAMENPEWVPPGRPFAEERADFVACAARISPELCDDLEALLAEDPAPTKDTPPRERQRNLCQALRHADGAASPAFLAAAMELVNLATWINGTKDKARKKRAAELPVVRLAGELEDRMKRLRWSWRQELHQAARSRLESALRTARQITYDGVRSRLRDALTSPTGAPLVARLREQFRVGLIDESQDTDPQQFDIFRTIFLGGPGGRAPATHRLALIGDPKQAIYGFRGADVNTYLEAKSRAKRRFQLSRTFRAPEPLVQAINVFFARPGSFLKEDLPFVPTQSGLSEDRRLEVPGEADAGRVEAWLVPDVDGAMFSANPARRDAIAGIVATHIVHLLSRGADLVTTSGGVESSRRPVVPADIAVLVSCAAEASAVTEALRSRSVPAVQARAQDVLGTDEAREIFTVLTSLLEPRNRRRRAAALTTRLLGRTVDSLAGASSAAEEESESALAKFQRWQAAWDRAGVAAAFAAIDADEQIIERLAALANGERRVTNFRQIVDLLQTTATRDGRHPEHLVRWLGQEIGRAEGRTDVDERQQQLDRDDQAVRVVTMHAAKGLEYPLVFCPFLWTGVRKPGDVEWFRRSERAPLVVNFGLEPAAELLEQRWGEALEDRLRLAYVAMTRAQVKVWILAGEACGRKTAASALDWLLRDDQAGYGPEWRRRAEGNGRGSRHGETLASLAGSAGLIRCSPPPAITDQVWTPNAAVGTGDWAVLPMPRIPEAWGVTSFSSLTREKHPQGATDEVDTVPAPPRAPVNAFTTLPGGALVGTVLHDWIERWDFREMDRASLDQRVAACGVRDGGEGASFGAGVADMLEQLRAAVLPGLGVTVAEACPDPGASEWHFHLPIDATISPATLAEAFDEDPAYAAALAALPAGELAGYLQGFLDRLAWSGGAWGVIDWKTNRLPHDDYSVPALEACARRSHYWLQTHLYLVALRRFLGPQTPIAGAWLVFLRGVRAGTADGVLHVKPSSATLAALDRIFARAQREEAHV